MRNHKTYSITEIIHAIEILKSRVVVNMRLYFLNMNLIILVLFLSFSTSSFGQTPANSNKTQNIWEIAPEVYNGMTTFENAYNAVDMFYSALKSIENGEKPDIEKLEADEWKVLVEACEEATFDIRRAKYATDFNVSQYSIAPDQFKCENKQWIITTLTSYKENIISAVQLGKKDIAKLDESINHAEKLLLAVRECIKIYQKVLGLPIYQEIFLWDWFALENAVRPAVAEYLSELRKHRNKYQKEIDIANKHWISLENNIEIIKDCDKPKPVQITPKPVFDFYSGTFKGRQIDVSLKRLDNYYMSKGYIKRYGQAGSSTWEITRVVENKNSIIISTRLNHTDGSTSTETYEGTISSNKRKITLKRTSPNSPDVFEVTLRP